VGGKKGGFNASKAWGWVSEREGRKRAGPGKGEFSKIWFQSSGKGRETAATKGKKGGNVTIE